MLGKKKREIERLKKKNERLLAMVEYEKQNSKGHEQVAQIQNAYVSILLKKLGATSEDTAIVIKNEEITNALDHCETRGSIPDIGVWKLYCEEDISD